MTGLRIFGHSLVLTLWVAMVGGYFWAIALKSYPVHAHIIMWLAIVGVGAAEAYFLIRDLNK